MYLASAPVTESMRGDRALALVAVPVTQNKARDDVRTLILMRLISIMLFLSGECSPPD